MLEHRHASERVNKQLCVLQNQIPVDRRIQVSRITAVLQYAVSVTLPHIGALHTEVLSTWYECQTDERMCWKL